MYSWQETSEVLSRFGTNDQDARSNYERFVAEGLHAGKRPELTGGGLVRSAGGWQEVVAARRAGIFLKSDERILGDSDFVERVLNSQRSMLRGRAHIVLKGLIYAGLPWSKCKNLSHTMRLPYFPVKLLAYWDF